MILAELFGPDVIIVLLIFVVAPVAIIATIMNRRSK